MNLEKDVNENSKREYIKDLFSNSRKISQLAIGLSITAHFLVLVAVNITDFEVDRAPSSVVENYVDLGYQQFDEVPQIVETNVPTTKDIVDTVPDKSDPAPVANEMQDQSSDVAGLQKESTTPTPPTPSTNKNVTQVPYYKIKPKYPKEALLSGIEGHVMVEIDIEEDGSVKNIQVKGGEKLTFFETEARRAIVKWKYKPFLNAEGNPIKIEKYLVRVDFKLNDDQMNN